MGSDVRLDIGKLIEGIDKDTELAYLYVLANIHARDMIFRHTAYKISNSGISDQDVYKLDCYKFSEFMKYNFILSIKRETLEKLTYDLFTANSNYMNVNKGVLSDISNTSFGITDTIPEVVHSILRDPTHKKVANKLGRLLVIWNEYNSIRGNQ